MSARRTPLVALLLACTDVKPDSDPISEGPELVSSALGAGSPPACIAEEYPILFTSTRGASENGLELYVMSFEGAVKQIGFGPRFLAPRWSPDGRAVAFRHQKVRDPGVTITSQVQLLASDGSERVSLTEQEILPFTDSSVLPLDGPSWSPDGRSLAYAAADGENGRRVWLLPSEGGEPRRSLPALEAPHHSPSWAPDNSIALVVERSGVEDIWLVDADAPEPPAVNLTEGRVRMPRSLSWSPDGRYLAFSALDPHPPDAGGGDLEVYLLDMATHDITPLTRNDALDLHPVWSPDGSELLIARGRSAADADPGPLDTQLLQLWRVPLDDAESAEQITFEGWMNCSADWFSGRCAPP